MNPWLIATAGLLLLLIPCGIACLRGGPVQRLIGLELAADLTILVMAFLAEGMDRSSFLDLPLGLALLTFAGGLAFTRFLGTWR